MLNLPQALLDAIYAHGEETFPAECCGCILGTRDGDDRTAVSLVPATNQRAAERNDRYEIGPEDRKAAEDRATAEGLAVVGFYHSHPDHDAYFSKTDLENSEEYAWGEPWIPPTYAYVVVSIHGAKRSHSKTFLVKDGAAVEESTEL
ncbi:MAG: M67 family metallopeptidase [Planctomycetota bacterium]|jgi:proteasome lid subunit RPN8/RPN11|nr:M67 family metallopeptidase [Planctomycetota bacterium]